MFHSLQVLHLTTEAQNVRTGQRAASSTEAPASQPEEITLKSFHRWLDPERLFEDPMLCVILNETWENKRVPDLNNWRCCYQELTSEDPFRKQRAVISLSFALATFVSSEARHTDAKDIDNLVTWINAASPHGNVLNVQRVESRLKVTFPRHLLSSKQAPGDDDADDDGRASSKKKQKTAPTPQHQIQIADRERSEATHRAMQRSGAFIVQVQIQAENLRADSSRGVASTVGKAAGWSPPLPQAIIGKFIGKQGRQIQQLQRELGVKLSVVKHDDAQYVYIEAATDIDVSRARVAIGEKVRQLM